MSRIAFVSHGGGPLPLLGDAGHSEMVHSLAELKARLLPEPDLILLISAHWEAGEFRFASAPQPDLLYDYAGFPEAAYRLSYPAPGAPGQARALAVCLGARGWPVALDDARAWDHGVFVPLLLLYPEARVPVLQLSLKNTLDVAEHWALAQQLASRLPANTQVLGSGFSYHNMPGFFSPGDVRIAREVGDFAGWLDQTVQRADARDRWMNWAEAPAARANHPREEHLLPLVMCAAMAKGMGEVIKTRVMGVEARHYLWL